MMRDAFTEIERARSALWSLDPGTDRDTWVKAGMAAKAAGLDFRRLPRLERESRELRQRGRMPLSLEEQPASRAVTVASLFAAARAAGWTDGDEAPAKRPQSHQEKRQQPEASKPPLHDPRAIWDACKPATAEQEYIDRKRGCRMACAFITAR
jgi:putative DNA primase/helicase